MSGQQFVAGFYLFFIRKILGNCIKFFKVKNLVLHLNIIDCAIITVTNLNSRKIIYQGN
jgi:hypothetical protein